MKTKIFKRDNEETNDGWRTGCKYSAKGKDQDRKGITRIERKENCWRKDCFTHTKGGLDFFRRYTKHAGCFRFLKLIIVSISEVKGAGFKS